MTTTLAAWNALDPAAAAAAILPCNGSQAWAEGLAALRPFATDFDLTLSSTEQSAAQLTAHTQAELAAANREYEAKFDRIFIVCASGKSAAEMLAILRQRLANDPQTELHEAAEQQRQITQLRLRKWLATTP
jgi:2-oxo-4-hydroxy-4-carboxy-5-ureidoimidazoline decarboxylase